MFRADIFRRGEELVDMGIDVDEYQLILLDVDMEDLNGIQTARKIRAISDVPIAFVTAFISYALEGYKVNALRYILKEKETFRESVYECLDLVRKKNNDSGGGSLEFDFREGKRRIQLQSVVYVESRLHYCYFYVKEEKEIAVYSIREKLDQIEEKFDASFFLRIHKSCLVNLYFVSDISRYTVQLSIEKSLLISQPKYMEVKKRHLEFRGKLE